MYKVELEFDTPVKKAIIKDKLNDLFADLMVARKYLVVIEEK